jgi:hypothetical protein
MLLTSPVKVRIALCALLLLVFVSGDRVIASLLSGLIMKSQFRYTRLYRGGERNDVIIFGDSRGYNSIEPSILTAKLGIPTLNLSYNGMSTEISEVLLRDYLDRNAPPKIVAIELTNVETPSIELLDDFKLYSRFSRRAAELVNRLEPRIHQACKVSHLFTFNSEMFLRSLYYLKKPDQGSAIQRQLDETTLAALLARPVKSLRVLPENLEALQRIVKLCQERRIAARLFIAPYLPQYGRRLDIPEFINRVQPAVGSEVIHDYSGAISDTAYFMDRIHLNAKGCVVFTNKLATDGLFFIATPNQLPYADPLTSTQSFEPSLNH